MSEAPKITEINPGLKTPDGYALSVTQFVSDPPASKATVVIAPAMGAGQFYYHAFAKWLAARGYRVICFDYRGLEKAARVHSDMTHNILTWMKQDANTVLEYAREQAGEGELIWMGHSLGCQLLGGMDARHKVDRMVGVATGTGYWLRGDLSLLPKAMLLWFGLVLLLTPLFGYFPGRKLNVVTDLPKGVIWQWRKWCLNRDYVAGAEGPEIKAQFDALKLPLDILTFSDDELMSRGNSEDLYRLYPLAEGRHNRVKASDFGLKRIGHFGFFKSVHEQSLWPHALKTLFESRQ